MIGKRCEILFLIVNFDISFKIHLTSVSRSRTFQTMSELERDGIIQTLDYRIET